MGKKKKNFDRKGARNLEPPPPPPRATEPLYRGKDGMQMVQKAV